MADGETEGRSSVDHILPSRPDKCSTEECVSHSGLRYTCLRADLSVAGGDNQRAMPLRQCLIYFADDRICASVFDVGNLWTLQL